MKAIWFAGKTNVLDGDLTPSYPLICQCFQWSILIIVGIIRISLIKHGIGIILIFLIQI